MDYSELRGGEGAGEASAALDKPDETKPAEKATFFLPDFPESEGIKAGDTLKVVGRSADGIEVEHLPGGERQEEGKWTDELKNQQPEMGGEGAM